MNKTEGQKIVEFIETYYHRKLEGNEITAISKELKDFTFDDFENIKVQLLKKVDYFTVSQLHKIIQEYKELNEMKKHFGIINFEELYEN